MIRLALLVITGCVAAIVLARWLPGGRIIALVASSVLIYLASLVAWWFALYFQVVPLGRLLAQLHMYGANHPAFALGFFGPPAVPAVVFLVVQVRRGPRTAARESRGGQRRDFRE